MGRYPLLLLALFMIILPSVAGASDEPSASTGRAPLSGSAADYNGDGFADLAVGTPFESVSGEQLAGAVNVLYGTANGLSAEGNQLWHQDHGGVLDQVEDGDLFGSGLAPADYNGDGFTDLAVGAAVRDDQRRRRLRGSGSRPLRGSRLRSLLDRKPVLAPGPARVQGRARVQRLLRPRPVLRAWKAPAPPSASITSSQTTASRTAVGREPSQPRCRHPRWARPRTCPGAPSLPVTTGRMREGAAQKFIAP
jgi:hypothetical protein